ncbi:DUF3850 domain-containing protein [Achromobacter sp. NCFB-sbj8-Ac1-l]|uniref:DUF3850 domain-containing protein n=1 Tax=unclassified Achromobacter TaxID=2626865 RepID=UPI004046E2EC
MTNQNNAAQAQRDRYHILKTDPEAFQAVLSGAKTFEIRLNDRGYAVGDVLGLRETKHTGAEMRAGAPLVYTGRECQRFVSHVLTGYGLADGWCCLSFRLPHAGGASAPVAGEAHTALNEWFDKTDFIQKRIASGELPVKYLGWHRADVMRDLIDVAARNQVIPSGCIVVQEADTIPHTHPEYGPGIFFTEDARIEFDAAPQASEAVRDAGITISEDVELPPLPEALALRPGQLGHTDQTLDYFARAAVLADRQQRAALSAQPGAQRTGEVDG